MNRLPGMGGVPSALTKEVKEAIDYWKEYRGQKIRIERVDLNRRDDGMAATKTRYGVEGSVERVVSLPPGFILSDVVEFTDPIFIEQIRDEGPESETHEKLFISFDSVERISFPDQ